jgi:uncharacterized protein (DUF305 family)
MLRFIIIISFAFTACMNNTEGKGHLDSLMKSEDSLRMIQNIGDPLIDINNMVITNDPDIDFARLIKEYYQTALNGAEIEINKGKNQRVIAIAKDQIKHHKEDILRLDEYVHNSTPQQLNPEFIKAFKKQLKVIEHASHPEHDFDEQFLSLTIRHHEEAIALCHVYLQYSNDPQLKSRAQLIIKAHTPEIGRLKNILKSL